MDSDIIIMKLSATHGLGLRYFWRTSEAPTRRLEVAGSAISADFVDFFLLRSSINIENKNACKLHVRMMSQAQSATFNSSSSSMYTPLVVGFSIMT
jgi:hypothetical protein